MTELTDPEITRQAAHVLLDALSIYDDLGVQDPDRAIGTALQRLGEIGAIRLLVDDEAETKTVDARPLLLAALQLITASTTQWLDARPDRTGFEVIAILRGSMDAAAEGA